MKSKLCHVYLYVLDLDKSYKFYKEFLELLGYKKLVKEDWGFAFINGDISIWFEKAKEGHIKKGYHRKRIGLNHLAFKLDSKKAVDEFTKKFLNKNGISTLYKTPKAFPEYSKCYYAVFFEDPDRIKLEVTYHN